MRAIADAIKSRKENLFPATPSYIHFALNFIFNAFPQGSTLRRYARALQ
jgi:hypothetical protein